MTELTCIVCPKGCFLKVDEENGYKVTGNSCEKGAEYGYNELKNPTRVITSTVKTNSAVYPRCPVRTDGAIPKAKMFEAMRLLDKITLSVPIKSGEKIIENIVGTTVSFINTKQIDK